MEGNQIDDRKKTVALKRKPNEKLKLTRTSHFVVDSPLMVQ
jgi:hypothetical protein